MKYILDDSTVDKFVEFGVNVWDIEKGTDKYAIANAAIDKTREYFVSLGMPTKLSEVGIGEDKLEEMAKKSVRFGKIGSLKPIDHNDVFNILKAAL